MHDIVKLVPTSHWTFACFKGEGACLEDVLSDIRPHGFGASVWLESELAVQRRKAAKGPIIASTLTPLAGYESGVTLIFASSRATFGILSIFRAGGPAPFTSPEIRSLTFALEASSEAFAKLALLDSIGQNRHENASRTPVKVIGWH